MKVRIRFSKTGPLVYIGHLDVMRYFQKLFRRADIPVAYSEGFSPHQILSFTPPLPLGMESDGEYADVELTESVRSEDALERLRARSIPYITLHSFRQLPEKCENAMAAVKSASYSLLFENGAGDIERCINDLIHQDELYVTKKTKKSEREINIRPLIYEISADPRKNMLNMTICSGSVDNIKPELVMEALVKLTGFTYDPDALLIKRIDQFTDINGVRVSLDSIGEDII